VYRDPPSETLAAAAHPGGIAASWRSSSRSSARRLRGRLGFRGVTMTDAIGAGALARFGGVAQRAVLAARAGADLILTSNSVNEGDSVTRGLESAIADRRLSRGVAEAAVSRIIDLRARLAR